MLSWREEHISECYDEWFSGITMISQLSRMRMAISMCWLFEAVRVFDEGGGWGVGEVFHLKCLTSRTQRCECSANTLLSVGDFTESGADALLAQHLIILFRPRLLSGTALVHKVHGLLVHRRDKLSFCTRQGVLWSKPPPPHPSTPPPTLNPKEIVQCLSGSVEELHRKRSFRSFSRLLVLTEFFFKQKRLIQIRFKITSKFAIFVVCFNYTRI